MSNVDEKVINKVKKMLNQTVENGATEQEAQAFMLKAQKLMVKHDISMSDVTEGTGADKEVLHGGVDDIEKRSWWQGKLASVIADNFRCYYYLQTYGSRGIKVVFLGLKDDVELAKEIYQYASKVMKHHAKLYVKNYKKQLEKEADVDFKKDFNSIQEIEVWGQDNGYVDSFEVATMKDKYGYDEKIYKMRLIMSIKEGMGITVDGHGLKNDYILGFIDGLREKFREQVENQEWGLILVKDQEVKDSFENMDLRTGRASSARRAGDSQAKQAGFEQGKAFNGAPKGYVNQ